MNFVILLSASEALTRRQTRSRGTLLLTISQTLAPIELEDPPKIGWILNVALRSLELQCPTFGGNYPAHFFGTVL